jgi:hypothetical protein
MTRETRSESTKRVKRASEKYLEYLIDCIDGEGYGEELVTDRDKIQFLFNTFKSEYVCEAHLKRYETLQGCFEEWIQGLPSCFNIPFYNYDIIALAKEMGSLVEDATEKQEDKIIENYWRFITTKVFRLFRREGLI